MPGNIVGEAWVAIRPDLSKFTTALVAGLAEAHTKAQWITDTHPIKFSVDVDTKGALAALGATRGALNVAATPPITFTVAINSAKALAELAVIRAIAGLSVDAAVASAVAGAAGGGRGGGGFAARAAPGGGGPFSGLLTGAALTKLLGFGPGGGTGAGIPFTGIAMAGAFSVLSMAGLGLEHVLTTLIGLVASLAGAIGGALLLALGAAGVAFVGMGSDMLVMKSVIADTKTLSTALTAIRVAQVTYGKNSAQAAAATANLNVQMQLLGNTAGVKAELGLAKAGQALNIFWDKATSSARVAAVGFLTPFLAIAYTYIPLINSAATANFGIMTQAFKPLIAYIQGPATGVFKELEAIFAKNLPTAIDALTQGIEFLIKTIAYLAPSTGGLSRAIDDLLKKANSPAGFATWVGWMKTLIGLFHTWWAFFSILAKNIVDFFKLTAGLGSSIIQSLTGMLGQLHAWLNLTTTKTSLHNLFELHKQEVLELLKLLPILLGALANVYLAVAPALTLAFTAVLTVIVQVLKALTSFGAGAWLVGVTLILAKLRLLTTALGLIKGAVTGILGLGSVATSATSPKTGILGLGAGIQKVWVMNPGFGGGLPSAAGTVASDILPAAAADTGVLAAGGLGAAGVGETTVLSSLMSGPILIPIFATVATAAIAYFGIQSILTESRKNPAAQAADAAAIRKNLQNAANPNAVGSAGNTGFGLFNLPATIKAIQVSAANAKAEWNTLDLLSKGGKRDWNMFFSQLGGELKSTLQSGSNIGAAENELYSLFKAGKIKNGAQLKAWEDSWNLIQVNTGKNATFAEGLATQMEIAGKLTDKQVPAYITAFNLLVKGGMNPASITAVDIANELLLAKATAANLNQTLDTINSSLSPLDIINLIRGRPRSSATAPKTKPGGHTISITQSFPHSANPKDVQQLVAIENRKLLVALRSL